MAVGDVVTLDDGSVGVVAEVLSGPRDTAYWRVWFNERESHVVNNVNIASTLSAPTYNVGDEVTVWPDIGIIQSVNGSDYTVQLEKSRRIEGLGHITWSPDVVVPFWRLVRDNDTRLERIW